MHAHLGEYCEAKRLAREAIAIVEQTDTLNMRGNAYWTSPRCSPRLSEEESARALEQALERYEHKKNLAMVAQMKPKLEQLRKAAPTQLVPARRGSAWT